MADPTASQFQSIVAADKTATIASGGTLSSAIDLVGTFLCGMEIPSNFDGTQIRFQTSSDNVTFQPVYNILNQRVVFTTAASQNISIAPTDFSMWRYIKVETVTTQSTSDTIIKLVTRPLT